MSQVFTCGCGRKTTQPFIISGKRMCTICAEDEAPDIVSKRERKAVWDDRTHRIPMRKYGNRE